MRSRRPHRCRSLVRVSGCPRRSGGTLAMKVAAEVARRRLADEADANVVAAGCMMRSVSRAVMRSDSWLAARLERRGALCGFAHRSAGGRRARGAGGRQARQRERGGSVQRMMAPWTPCAKRLVLMRVESEDQAVAEVVVERGRQSDAAHGDALCTHWRPDFERGPTDVSVRVVARNSCGAETSGGGQGVSSKRGVAYRRGSRGTSPRRSARSRSWRLWGSACRDDSLQEPRPARAWRISLP